MDEVIIFSICFLLLSFVFFFRRFRQTRIIVPHNSLGLKYDAELYANVIPRSYVVYINWKSPRRHWDYWRFSKANVFVERSQIGKGFPSLHNYLLPNPEFFHVKGTLPDVFLCKTQYTQRVLSQLGKVVYVGHTSFDCGGYGKAKDENLMVLFAGKSWLKNVDKAIEAWLRNPDFPRLVVTCSKKKLLEKFGEIEPRDNLTIYERLSDEQLNAYAQAAGAFLCPSSIEGFGHYINEGRAAGALVITTDFPPMNELVDDSSGILISVDNVVDASTLVGQTDFGFDYDDAFELKAVTLSVENIEAAIRRYMAMPVEERQVRREKSRHRYLVERDAWKTRILALLGG